MSTVINQYELSLTSPANTVGDNTPVSQTSQSSDTPFASGNDQSNLASRVETSEKYIQDLKENGARLNTDVTFKNAKVSDRLEANFGKIGGWDINAGVLSTPKLIIDSNNEVIKSANYIPGVSGFKVSQDLVETENIKARGSLQGVTFSYDKISAIGGQLMVANADSLASDMTVADNSTLTTKGDTTFAVNDILVMRGIATSGIQEEWFRITNIDSAPTYIVTRDLAATYAANSNPAFKAGTPVVKQGSSNGTDTYSGGWLRLIGEGTNSPYYSVYQRTGVSYNAFAEVSRFGNLNGFLDYSTDLYGISIGDSTANLCYDISNGFRLRGVSKNFFRTIADDTVVTAPAGASLTANQSMTKMKEVLFNDSSGTIRVYSYGRVNSNNGTHGSVRIYINGSAVGSALDIDWVDVGGGEPQKNHSEDFTVVTGDLIQMYASIGNSAGSCAYQLRYAKTGVAETNTVNL